MGENQYDFKIDWTSSEPFDPMNEAVDVVLTMQGQEYYASFVTRKFIDRMFEKNRRTGECATGTYFCMPGMIVVDKINDQNIRATIDDLIANLEIAEYFRKID